MNFADSMRQLVEEMNRGLRSELERSEISPELEWTFYALDRSHLEAVGSPALYFEIATWRELDRQIRSIDLHQSLTPPVVPRPAPAPRRVKDVDTGTSEP